MKTQNEIEKKLAWDKFTSYVLERDSRQFSAFSEYLSLQNKDANKKATFIEEELEM